MMHAPPSSSLLSPPLSLLSLSLLSLSFLALTSLFYSPACGFTFTSELATDLQPFFLDQPHGPYIGGDIATSIPIPSASSPQRVLWLYGDTFTGSTTANGSRIIQGMPRNSVGLLNVSAQGKVVSAALQHFLRTTSDPAKKQHVGFFTPHDGDAKQWYWPTTALYLNSTLYVFGLRMGPHPDPLFPFETIAVDVMVLSDTHSNDPLQWKISNTVSIPHVNNSFVVTDAVGVSEKEGYVYFLGGYGASNSRAMMARVTVADFIALRLNNIEYLVSPSYSAREKGHHHPHHQHHHEHSSSSTPPSQQSSQWEPFSPSLVPYPLFPSGPSESTMQYHPFMQQWAVVIVNTFLSNQVQIRLAPHPEGPWSDAIGVYTIPSSFLSVGFCYAGKSHPEFMPSPDSPEMILTYMCNTPKIDGLINRPDIYVPRVIRVKISG